MLSCTSWGVDVCVRIEMADGPGAPTKFGAVLFTAETQTGQNEGQRDLPIVDTGVGLRVTMVCLGTRLSLGDVSDGRTPSPGLLA